jgi:hypothetical protein
MVAAGIPTTAIWRDVQLGPISEVLDVVGLSFPLRGPSQHC